MPSDEQAHGTALLPLRQRAHLPMPDLPSSSGAFWGSRADILKQDTAHVVEHSNFLAKRVTQANTMVALVEGRIALSLAMSKLASIDEVTAAEYLKGRRQRASELRLRHLECETAEVNAELALAAARKQLSAVAPRTASADAAAPGLTPTEIDELVSLMPEISPETRETLSRLLLARVQEKKS